MKEIEFTQKDKKRKIPRRTIMDPDYPDDIALLVNIPTQAESLLQILEQAAGGIGLHANADKMDFTCFIKKKTISLL